LDCNVHIHYHEDLIWYIKLKVPRNRTESPEGGRSIALHFLDPCARRGWVVNTTPRSLYPGTDPVPIVQEVGWAPGSVWTCTKNLVLTGIFFFLRSYTTLYLSSHLVQSQHPRHVQTRTSHPPLHLPPFTPIMSSQTPPPPPMTPETTQSKGTFGTFDPRTVQPVTSRYTD
jgi:hypothetical protein